MIKLVTVNELPRKRMYNSLLPIIEQFVNGDAKIVKIEYAPNDYKSPNICQTTFYQSIKRSGYKNISVKIRNGEVYLVKTE